MNPQVVPEDIKKLYPKNYAPHSAIEKKPDSKIRLTKRIIKRIKRISIIELILKKLTNVIIEDSIYSKLSKHSRILDVGCGTGAFLNSVKSDKGCQVHGVDISESAVAEAKNSFGLDIFKGNITELPLPDDYFDIITSWWYLEHIHNPHTSIKKISNLLKADGYCIIGIPNFKSFNAKVFKDKWYHLDCPRHLCIWTPNTIKRLLEKYGLSTTKIIYDKTPWGLLGSLQYVFFGDNINPKHHNRIIQSIFLRILLLPWTIIVAFLKRADIMVIYAKKSESTGSK
jgi:ubiquinone/menaquinone biosynthesis C-methylase UbiE